MVKIEAGRIADARDRSGLFHGSQHPVKNLPADVEMTAPAHCAVSSGRTVSKSILERNLIAEAPSSRR